mmetsp:Transcript_74669/g.139407  ORF Transcript_74669/g.139407 Transcript_74669/m.139407 type:complete len:99 (+) Transcript_74669:126-422(+)
MLQQAVFWNIALAVVVLPEWGHYTTLPLEVLSSWFWFFPDLAFMAIGPTSLQESGSLRSPGMRWHSRWWFDLEGLIWLFEVALRVGQVWAMIIWLFEA